MVQMSMVKRTLDAKKNAGVAVIAMQLAKDKNDPFWQKASRAKKMFQAAKLAIASKYGAQARMMWSQKQSGARDRLEK